MNEALGSLLCIGLIVGLIWAIRVGMKTASEQREAAARALAEAERAYRQSLAALKSSRRGRARLSAVPRGAEELADQRRPAREDPPTRPSLLGPHPRPAGRHAV